MTPAKTAITLASAAALLALSGAALPGVANAKTTAQIHCFGVNTCKGTSDCKSGNHACKGMNDCKGQGFRLESAKQCKTDGGSLTAPM